MSNLVQYRKTSLKSTAIRLRERGFSYTDILKFVSVSRGTLSRWFKKIALTEAHIKKLQERRLKAARRGTETRKRKMAEAIEKIKIASARAIRNISKRELWLMGLMLYAREGLSDRDEKDFARGVRFSSSDPHLVQLFLAWLQSIGGLGNDEIGFDIFISDDTQDAVAKSRRHWASITGFPRESFSHVYFQKKSSRDNGSEISEAEPARISNLGRRKRIGRAKGDCGFLRVRVRASAMLARQIAGWIRGIREYEWVEQKASLLSKGS